MPQSLPQPEEPRLRRPLALVGMSGVGKSYWAKQLAQQGWRHLDCDAQIAARLSALLAEQPGAGSADEEPVHAVGRWMGMPWSAGYDAREQQYLELERAVTAEVLGLASDSATRPEPIQTQPPMPGLVASAEPGPTVIDTTGSVIYTGAAMLDRLKRSACVVYFEVPDAVREQMVALYLREPKPVLWQGGYRPRPGESRDAALARCYAQLLADRAQQYRALADVVLDYHALRAPGCDVARVLAMIASTGGVAAGEAGEGDGDGAMPGVVATPADPARAGQGQAQIQQRYRYTSAHRLSGDKQFQAVFKNKLRKNAGPLAVLALPNTLPHHRFGMTVPRRVGNAVTRHRIKRRLREAFRLNQHGWPGRYDLVVLVHPHAVLPMQQYADYLNQAVGQAHTVAQRRQAR